MRRQAIPQWRALGLVVAALLVAAPVFSAGFGIFEQGTKAMGMASAFAAQGDDPSTLFFNVGGLAFFDEREFALGATYITSTDATWKGTGALEGLEAEQESLSEIPPHFYFIQPIGEKWNFGFSLNAPFGLTTDWKDKDNFPGRFISEMASLTSFDVGAHIGVKLSDKFGLGFGILGRFSEVELENRQSAVLIPGAPPFEIAQVQLTSDLDSGIGWQIGVLHRYNNSFSWSLYYKSKVEIDYNGEAQFTQIPTGIPPLDAAVGGLLPFGQKVSADTSIEFPDMAGIGLAFVVSPKWLIETDFNWTGWSSFDELVLDFGNPMLDTVLEEDWDDVWNYRLGVKWMWKDNGEWRFGYVYDETPQPEKSVSPLLPGANRNGFSVGYGFGGGKLTWDLAVMYVPFDDRTTNNQQNGFTGTYETTAWLFGLTLGF